MNDKEKELLKKLKQELIQKSNSLAGDFSSKLDIDYTLKFDIFLENKESYVKAWQRYLHSFEDGNSKNNFQLITEVLIEKLGQLNTLRISAFENVENLKSYLATLKMLEKCPVYNQTNDAIKEQQLMLRKFQKKEELICIEDFGQEFNILLANYVDAIKNDTDTCPLHVASCLNLLATSIAKHPWLSTFFPSKIDFETEVNIFVLKHFLRELSKFDMERDFDQSEFQNLVFTINSLASTIVDSKDKSALYKDVKKTIQLIQQESNHILLILLVLTKLEQIDEFIADIILAMTELLNISSHSNVIKSGLPIMLARNEMIYQKEMPEKLVIKHLQIISIKFDDINWYFGDILKNNDSLAEFSIFKPDYLKSIIGTGENESTWISRLEKIKFDNISYNFEYYELDKNFPKLKSTFNLFKSDKRFLLKSLQSYSEYCHKLISEVSTVISKADKIKKKRLLSRPELQALEEIDAEKIFLKGRNFKPLYEGLFEIFNKESFEEFQNSLNPNSEGNIAFDPSSKESFQTLQNELAEKAKNMKIDIKNEIKSILLTNSGESSFDAPDDPEIDQKVSKCEEFFGEFIEKYKSIVDLTASVDKIFAKIVKLDETFVSLRIDIDKTKLVVDAIKKLEEEGAIAQTKLDNQLFSSVKDIEECLNLYKNAGNPITIPDPDIQPKISLMSTPSLNNDDKANYSSMPNHSNPPYNRPPQYTYPQALGAYNMPNQQLYRPPYTQLPPTQPKYPQFGPTQPPNNPFKQPYNPYPQYPSAQPPNSMHHGAQLPYSTSQYPQFQPNSHYQNQQYLGTHYPNQQYPSQQYPNQQYPNQHHQNAQQSHHSQQNQPRYGGQNPPTACHTNLPYWQKR